MTKAGKLLCFLGLEPGRLLQLRLHQISVVDAVLELEIGAKKQVLHSVVTEPM